MIKRLLRLYPLTLLATGVCLLWGSYWMLPYTYQDLAQNVIATNLFANNILMSIKSSDYWNVLNDYKPLMHTWYLGIIVQFYVVFALIVIVTKKIFRSKRDITPYIVGVCLLGSLVLYLLPCFNATQKFYFLPFRIFEFCAGCLTAYWASDRQLSKTPSNILALCAYVLIFCLLFINADYLSATARLLSTVVLTCVLLVSLPFVSHGLDKVVSNKWLAVIGKASFSIYIWHQIVFAFCRYSFTAVFDTKVFALTILITGLLAYLSYKYVEQGMANYLKRVHGERNTLIGCIGSALVLTGVAFWLNACSGVIRDVPELDTYVGKTAEHMHIAYNDRVYAWDKAFVTDKQHWLVWGNSYGRDWANILSESHVEDEVEISYVYSTKTDPKDRMDRIKDADLIFLTITEIHIAKTVESIDQSVSDMLDFCDSVGIDPDKIRIVGSKRFGQCLGQIYAQRNRPDYHSLSADLNPAYFEHNDLMREKYTERFIDLLGPVRTGIASVRVFSDDNKIISQDTEHLTQNGAKYYARLLEDTISGLLESVRKNNEK